MKNILWLTEWLPTSFEPFNGDGIERRAKAASLYNNIFIVYVKKDPNLRFGKTRQEERIYNGQCKAFIYYYPSIREFSRFLDLLLSNYYFIRLHNKAFKEFKKKYGKPAGIQVNVTMKNGIIAWYYKWKWKIRYIVVEGWSIFLPEAKPSFKDKGWLFRSFTRKILKRTALLITVSKHLGEMIQKNVVNLPYKVIPSVVDKTIFYFPGKRSSGNAFRFIHVSNLDHAKNIEQLLLGFKQVISSGHKAELIIHAPQNDLLRKQISELGLNGNIVLKEEISQTRLADSIRSSDALVLFSLYETFGNVVIEAQACGIPVIVSDYPTFLETVENNVNGIIAKGKEAPALAEAMISCIKNKEGFDGKQVSQKAIAAYSFEHIGKMLDEVYQQCF